MSTTTKRAPKKSSKSTTAKNKTAKATTTKADDGPSKTALRQERDTKLTERMLELRAEDTSWGDIATELSITPGKAQFLFMLNAVAEGDVPRITGTEATIAAKIIAAREKNDQYSSWGWIAARTGLAEGTVKKLAEEAGHAVKGSNVAVARSEANPKKPAKRADTKTKTQANTKAKSSGTASKAAKAKARAKAARSKTSDPS